MIDQELEIANMTPAQVRIAFLIAMGCKLVTHEGSEDTWPYQRGLVYWADKNSNPLTSACGDEDSANFFVTEGELDLASMLEKLPTNKHWWIINKPGYGFIVHIEPGEAHWACNTLDELPLTICKAYLDWKRYEPDHLSL